MSKYKIVPQGRFNNFYAIENIETSGSVAQYLQRDFAERIVKALEVYDELEAKFRTATLDSGVNERLASNRYIVASDWIGSVGYDSKTKTIRLYKKDGDTITHTGVPYSVVSAILNAESVGRMWNRLVKGNPDYTFIE